MILPGVTLKDERNGAIIRILFYVDFLKCKKVYKLVGENGFLKCTHSQQRIHLFFINECCVVLSVFPKKVNSFIPARPLKGHFECPIYSLKIKYKSDSVCYKILLQLSTRKKVDSIQFNLKNH